jgi:peptide/nickel transport system substrate-binding protein
VNCLIKMKKTSSNPAPVTVAGIESASLASGPSGVVMQRRHVLRSALGGLALSSTLSMPGLALPNQQRVLRYVPQADLGSFDPIWTTSIITRDHGFMIYDTLYGTDDKFNPQPQLAAGHQFENEGLECVITLRSGLRFQDGEPVRAQDAVASLKRWMVRAPVGQKLLSQLDDLAAVDDMRLRFRFRRAMPTLIALLALPSSPVPFVMPERIAKTDPYTAITETIGCGPFRFKRDEFVAGSQIVYERNVDYQPTPIAATGLTAGPKLVHFDRVEWKVIPEAATAAVALQQGEIDWFGQPPSELVDLLHGNQNIKVGPLDLLPTVGALRFNFLHPVFSDKSVRKALLPAVNQSDFIVAAVGTDPARSIVPVGVFPPGSPMATRVGLEPLLGPRDLGKAKQALHSAGYNGQLVRILGPTDILIPSALTQVGVDLFRRLGLNLDVALTDWGTVVQRRTNRETVDHGGWSASFYAFPGTDFLNPATHPLLRGNGKNAWFGWPTIPRLEELRDAWFEAPDLAAQQHLAQVIQQTAMEELPFIPLGGTVAQTALRKDLTDRVIGFPIFWGIRRT